MEKILISLTLILLTACSTTPTGRSQLKLLSDSKLDSMGSESFQQMKQKTPASRNPRYVNPTQCIVRLLLERNGFNPGEWELVVFASDQINAFALPGKKIGVYEGLFKAAQNQHQLAAVIGHEIGHVTADHGNERVSQQLALNGLLIGSAVALKDNENAAPIMAGLGLGANVGVILPFSRSHESEADEIGIGYMAKAGFDPRQAVNLWVNMSKQGKSAPELLSTHPSSKTRIKKIQKLLPDAEQVQRVALTKYPAPNCGY